MKVRDLQKSHNFREAVKKWGEPQGRKKVYFASNIVDTANPGSIGHQMCPLEVLERDDESKSNDVNIPNNNKLSNVSDEIINLDDVITRKREEYESLRWWISERRLLREQMKSIGLTKKWMENKPDKTESENHVYAKLKNCSKEETVKNDIIPKKYIRKPRLSEAHVEFLPFLNSPLPIALAIIADFLHDHRLRLIDLFKKIDKNKDWRMTREELKLSLKETSIPLTDAHLDELILAVDSNNDNELSYKELARGIEAYHKDRRWQKLKSMYDNIIENDGHTKRQRRSSVADRKAAVDVLLLPKFNELDDRSAAKEKQRMQRIAERRERARTETKRNDKLVETLPWFSSASGILGQRKVKYLQFVSAESDRCYGRLVLDGLIENGESLNKALVPPTDNSHRECKMYLTSHLSAYPVTHPLSVTQEKQRRRKLKKSQAGVTLVSSRDNESSLSQKQHANKIVLPRVASLDLNDRISEAKNFRREIQSASPTVFWPQHLLDKIRLCMDKNESISGPNVMFHRIQR